ncbi:hypothetical protein CVT25_000104 [Psilocybe cyanescens]|uniref:Nephrocystin 3-like N-terminal domain-containing protein n=1 Tax=Psilocybe cyanescens TaxID=93625 RepID=A0A409XQE0_PSICY|nr:hypothetical protein CVT25_000104 [Psilocybe cyanescens]
MSIKSSKERRVPLIDLSFGGVDIRNVVNDNTIEHSMVNTAGRDVIVHERHPDPIDSEFFSILSIRNLNKSTQELRMIANWLTPINFRTIHRDTFSKRTLGTGTWLIDNPEFQEWLSKNDGRLVITGIPGAGKTVLSSIVIDYLDNMHSKENHNAVVFMYCRHDDMYTVTDFLGSLVKQLVEEHLDRPSIFQAVNDMHDAHRRKETHPSEMDLLELLQQLFSSFKKVFIIFDAFDEVSYNVRSSLLAKLLSLHAVLLITSRPLGLGLELSKTLLPDVVHIYIEAQTQSDIQLFVRNEVKANSDILDLVGGDDLCMNKVCTKIEENSKGM